MRPCEHVHQTLRLNERGRIRGLLAQVTGGRWARLPRTGVALKAACRTDGGGRGEEGRGAEVGGRDVNCVHQVAVLFVR